MENIRLTAKFRINSGQVDKFKQIANDCLVVVKEKEASKGTLQYDWYFDESEQECHVLETYANSDAVMAHIANVGPLLEQLLQTSSLSGDIYGNLSPELEEAFKGLDVKTFSFFQGV